MPKEKKQSEKVDIEKAVEEALRLKSELKKVIRALSKASRLDRQSASTIVYKVALADVSKVEPYIDEIIDALKRPEGQTRWRVLQTLTLMLPEKSKQCSKALEDAEESLFDESMGSLRLSAFIFFCKYGKTTEVRSKEVWPLIDEAIQCYHGDAEFDDMLDSLIEFSKGKLDAYVKLQLAQRMAFDSENATGHLKSASLQIINNVSKVPKKSK
jgi:hypothetical protein